MAAVGNTLLVLVVVAGGRDRDSCCCDNSREARDDVEEGTMSTTGERSADDVNAADARLMVPTWGATTETTVANEVPLTVRLERIIFFFLLLPFPFFESMISSDVINIYVKLAIFFFENRQRKERKKKTEATKKKKKKRGKIIIKKI